MEREQGHAGTAVEDCLGQEPKGRDLCLRCVVGSHRVLYSCLNNVSVNILQSGDTGERKPYGPAIIYTQYSLTIELAHVYY